MMVLMIAWSLVPCHALWSLGVAVLHGQVGRQRGEYGEVSNAPGQGAGGAPVLNENESGRYSSDSEKDLDMPRYKRRRHLRRQIELWQGRLNALQFNRRSQPPPLRTPMDEARLLGDIGIEQYRYRLLGDVRIPIRKVDERVGLFFNTEYRER